MPNQADHNLSEAVNFRLMPRRHLGSRLNRLLEEGKRKGNESSNYHTYRYETSKDIVDLLLFQTAAYP